MVRHKIVEVRRKPIESQRKRQFHYFGQGGWRRVASPFIIRLACSNVWRRAYVNQYDSDRGYRKGTYYVQVGTGWFTFNYIDLVPFIAAADAEST